MSSAARGDGRGRARRLDAWLEPLWCNAFFTRSSNRSLLKRAVLIAIHRKSGSVVAGGKKAISRFDRQCDNHPRWSRAATNRW